MFFQTQHIEVHPDVFQQDHLDGTKKDVDPGVPYVRLLETHRT